VSEAASGQETRSEPGGEIGSKVGSGKGAELRAAIGLLKAAGNFEELLQLSRTAYFAEGLQSLRGIPSASIDFTFSNAVLEHIPRAGFAETLRELRRVMSPGGLASHEVDLRDHLGGGLNHLRFGRGFWESRLVAGSGFYTNRIGFGRMLEMFREAGFAVQVPEVWRWTEPPIPASRLAQPFRNLPEEELSVKAFRVLLTPAPA
jgi:SAM-dependent methyltransferase